MMISRILTKLFMVCLVVGAVTPAKADGGIVLRQYKFWAIHDSRFEVTTENVAGYPFSLIISQYPYYDWFCYFGESEDAFETIMAMVEIDENYRLVKNTFETRRYFRSSSDLKGSGDIPVVLKNLNSGEIETWIVPKCPTPSEEQVDIPTYPTKGKKIQG